MLAQILVNDRLMDKSGESITFGIFSILLVGPVILFHWLRKHNEEFEVRELLFDLFEMILELFNSAEVRMCLINTRSDEAVAIWLDCIAFLDIDAFPATPLGCPRGGHSLELPIDEREKQIWLFYRTHRTSRYQD